MPKDTIGGKRSRAKAGTPAQTGETYEEYVERTLNNPDYIRENRPSEFLMQQVERGTTPVPIKTGKTNIKVPFNELQKGDTFEYDNGTTKYKLRIGRYNKDYGYMVEGSGFVNGKRDNVSAYLGYLQIDKKITDKNYQIPLSKTKNWKRK